MKDDYLIGSLIGKGNFAKVHLVRKKGKEEKTNYALKSVEKNLIYKSRRNVVK